MLSFTLRPKYARRTRNAACSNCSSWSSSAARTVHASPRLSGSPASALSANASHRFAISSVTTSDMRNLPGTDRDAREGADVDVVFDQLAEPLDQARVHARAFVGRAVEDHTHRLEPQLACGSHRQRAVIDGSEPSACDHEDRKSKVDREIGDRPVLAERDEEPARSLHEHGAVTVRDRANARDELVAVDGATLQLG